MHIVLQKVILAIGILINVLGTWFISRCLIKKTDMELMSENCFIYGYNLNYVLSGLKQKAEGNYGIVLLIIGSILQVFSFFTDTVTFIFINFNSFIAITIVVICTIILLVSLWLIGNKLIQLKYISKTKLHISKHRVVGEKTNIKEVNKLISLTVDGYEYLEGLLNNRIIHKYMT